MDNILLQEWTGPYGGVPAFDKMELTLLIPAIEQGIELQLKEIEAIVQEPEPPRFENTILAMEKAGKALKRVFTYYDIWSNNLSSSEFRKIQEELAPKIAGFQSKIIQNKKLFEKIRTVFKGVQRNSLPADQQRLTELIYEDFVMEGAGLYEGEAKNTYVTINEELYRLYTKFSNHVLADEEKHVVYLTGDQLSGLPTSFVRVAELIAIDRGQMGQYAVTNTRSSVDLFLTYSDERALREKVWSTYYNRADNGDENDNNDIIVRILKLRRERAALLGFDNYAEWRLQNRMAKSPERAMELMQAVWPAALARVEEELAEMKAIVGKGDKADITIKPWDYRYFAEKVRQQKYHLDSDEVKQYLQLDKLTEALFFVAGEVFNYKFTPVPVGTVPIFHEEVRVWEVTDKTGILIGLWYLDPFARKGKRSGAWANTYRSHTTFEGKKTVLASNNSNFIKPAPGEPVLLSWSEATTLFHEFGHALHYFASTVKYPSLNGGVRDFTEFQSQLLERWLFTDKIISQFLVHHATGKSIPADVVKKIKKSSSFSQGLATTEYLASALMDLKLHTVDPEGLDIKKFEKETLAALKIPGEIVMRHRPPHFGHIFSGESYATGYYSYIWADVLTSDAAEAFEEAPEGFYDKEMAAKLVKYLFEPQNQMDPSEAYRKFRGRDPKIHALMRQRNFPVPVGKKK